MKLKVPEAAERLGISQNAVRQRIKRGQIRTTKVKGRVFVILDQDDIVETKSEDQSQTNDLSELVKAKDEEIARLVEQLRESDKRTNEMMAMLKDEQEALQREQAIAMKAQQRIEQLLEQKALPKPGFFGRLFGGDKEA